MGVRVKVSDVRCRFQYGWRRWAGLSMGLLALGFYCCSVLRLDYLHSNLLDLPPGPDASEYYAMAQSMARCGPPKIQIGQESLPSRYPLGYAVLMLPWLAVLPSHLHILAPFRTSQSMGLLLLCFAWFFYWKRGQSLAAGVAALLLATLPAYVNYCRAPMSEISGTVLVSCAFLMAFQGIQKQERRWVYICAVFLGLAVNVRLQLILFGPVLLSMAMVFEKGKFRTWFLHCTGALGLFALFVCPSILLNVIEFGHPLKTGYTFWVPDQMDTGNAFSFRFLKSGALSLWNEFSLSSPTFTVGNLFGTGTHFTPAFILLAFAGCALLRGWKTVLCTASAVSCYTVGTMLYYYGDGRMYLPLFVLMVPVATLPVVRAMEVQVQRKHLFSVPILGLFFLALAGFPSQSGYPKQAWRSQFADLLSLSPHDMNRSAPDYTAASGLITCVGDRPGAVFSTINPVFLNAVLPAGFAAAPLDGQHPYSHSRLWEYGENQAATLVRHELDNARPVYALFTSDKERAAEMHRLPEVHGFSWLPLSPADGESSILHLQPQEGLLP